MRIFYSPESDPMLLDTAASLNLFYQKMSEFLDSDMECILFSAVVSSSPAPYQEFLNGLRIQKNRDYVKLLLSQSRWLELSGSVDNLKQYLSHFYFQESEQDGHHHPGYGDYMAKATIDSISLIVEADSSWEEDKAV